MSSNSFSRSILVTFRPNYQIKRGRLRRKIQEKRQTVEFLLGASFQNSRFPTRADFSKATFVAGASFSGATFGGRASFSGATFGDRASFSRATFGDRVSFSRATFYKRASFGGATFGDRAFFSVATFDKLAFFPGATFGANAFFFGATFGAGAFFDGATFDKLAFFSRATFGDHASFKRATFGDRAFFKRATFSDRAFFKRATFSDRAFFFEAEFCAGASFDGATFRADISLRSATVNGELNLVSTNWEGRADFRESIIQDLFWDSNDRPSGVKGVFDAREATFGKVTIKDVHFSDLVDFSDAEFGRSGNNSSDDDKPRTDSCGRKTDKSSPEQPGHESEKIIFEHTIFEKEVDFLRAEFCNDAIFVRNRFRGVWDLTDATFERKEGQDKKGEQEEEEKNSHLCLSFNRIGKLFMERKHLGYESSWTKDFFLRLLPLTALKKSRIRGVIGDEEYSCARVNESREKNENEDLWEIYRTIESSFREVNDRLAENEAWYLGMVADRESQYSDVKDWVSWIAVEYWASLILRDIPSRYGIDLYRVVLVSICLMLFFAIFYAYYFRRQIRINKRKQYVKLKPRPDQKRAFRFRPFERFFQSWQTWERQERPLHPCKDALFLSGRAFFKLGLGTAYPRTRMLVGIAIVEWIAGMYMLIHFLFVVRNTSPIAVPFLGVAG